MDANAYARQLKALLPPGSLFRLEPGSTLSKLLLAISDELARVDGRAADLLEEWDPRTTTEMIEDWERLLGLPDEFVTAIPGTIEGRRIAVTQKFTSRGGQNNAFFISLVEACGWVVGSISKFSMCRVGARVGDRVYGVAYAYSFALNDLDVTGAPGALDRQVMESVIRAHTHSYATPVFYYL